MFRYVGLDIGVGLEEESFVCVQGMGDSLKTCQSNAFRLGGDCRRTVEFHQRWEQGPVALLMLEQNGTTQNVPWV